MTNTTECPGTVVSYASYYVMWSTMGVFSLVVMIIAAIARTAFRRYLKELISEPNLPIETAQVLTHNPKTGEYTQATQKTQFMPKMTQAEIMRSLNFPVGRNSVMYSRI
jgi:hypothetical protein